MDLEICNRVLVTLRESGRHMLFEMLIGTTDSHVSLLLEVREVVPFSKWKLVSQVPKEHWLLSNHRESCYGSG